MPMLTSSWRIARSLKQLGDEVKAKYPSTTIWTVGDAAHQRRRSDHNSNPEGVICAIDVVGVEQAQDLWNFLANVRDPRMKYDIFDSQIMSSTYRPWVARRYTGSNPHANHIHVSVGRGPDNYSTQPDLYDDPSPWGFHTYKEGEFMLTKNNAPRPDGGSNAVKKLMLGLQNWNPKALPEFGRDGFYGDEMERWVRKYQQAADLPVTGHVDGVTSSFILEWVPDRKDRGGVSSSRVTKLERALNTLRNTFEGHRHRGGRTSPPL